MHGQETEKYEHDVTDVKSRTTTPSITELHHDEVGENNSNILRHKHVASKFGFVTNPIVFGREAVKTF